MARSLKKLRPLDNLEKKPEALYKNLTCPKCDSDNTWVDFEYGNKKCRDCGEGWDGSSHTIHS